MTSTAAVGWIRDRALTLLLMLMFAFFLVGQVATGLAEYNAEQQEHGQPLVTLNAYLRTGHPWEALFENWESEFLQMAVFVLLTTFLIQKGSPESRRPGAKELVDTDPRDFANDPAAPWPVRRGGLILRLYEHSLGLAFILLFLLVMDRTCRRRVLRVRSRPRVTPRAASHLHRLRHIVAFLVRVVSELAE